MEYIDEFDKDKFPWSKQAMSNVNTINASPDAGTIWAYFVSECEAGTIWADFVSECEAGDKIPTKGDIDDRMKYWNFPECYDGLRVYSGKEDFFVFKKSAWEAISEKLEIDSPEDQKYKKIMEYEWPDDVKAKFLDFVGTNRDLSFGEYKQFIMDYELQEDEEEEQQGDEEE